MVVQVSGIGLKPKGFSNYEKVEYVVNLPDSTAKVFSPSGNVVVPFADGERIGTVVPVKTISWEASNGVARHVFYGYYVVFRGGAAQDVLDAGVYERVFAESDKGVELGLPAKVVKRFSELSRRELDELVSATPPELLLPLHRSGQHELVSKAVADLLRRDPMKVVELPNEIIEKYVINSDDPIVRTALLENTPAMIKVLETQLKSRGFVEADKLSLVYHRYWEEELEDETLERASTRRVPEHRHEHRSRSAARLKALGVSLPLTVSMIALPILAQRLARKKEELVEDAVKIKA